MKRVKKPLARGIILSLICLTLVSFIKEKDINTPNATLTRTIVQDSKTDAETMSMMYEVVPSTATNLARTYKFATTVYAATNIGSNQEELNSTSSTPSVEEETTISTTTTVEEQAEPVKPVRKYFDIPLTQEQQDFIYDKCEEYELPSHVIFGMFEQESSFRIKCVSGPNRNGTYDYGIGQINSCHFDYIDKNKVLEFEYNVDESLKAVKEHRNLWDEKFSGDDLNRAMVNSYNMGQYGFKNNGYPLYRNHSNKIMKYAEKYK